MQPLHYPPLQSSVSWTSWGKNVVYKVGLSILCPFSARASALWTYSCLEEFLDPYRKLNQPAEDAIYALLLQNADACNSFQKLLDHALTGDVEKVSHRFKKFEDLVKEKEGSDVILSVARDVQAIAGFRKKATTLPQDVVEMKEFEEERRWEATHAISIPLIDAETLQADLSRPDILQRKASRRLRNLHSSPQLNAVDLQALKDFDSIEKALQSFLSQEEATSLANQLTGEMLFSSEDVVAFCERMERLSSHLAVERPEKYKHANCTLTRLFREVLETRVYTVLKEDPDHPVIRSLHRLAVALWSDVKALQAYQTLGSRMVEATGEYLPNESPLTPDEVIAQLQSSHAAAEKELYNDQGLGFIGYSIAHPKQVMQSMASYEGLLGSIANFAGEVHYDPHMQASNNPSLQGIKKASVGKNYFVIKNCYGGSPTIGRDVSPEFLALLQGVENNCYANQKDPHIPDRIFYINLQNMNLENGESPRSCAIMRLNFLFPKVFLGITLSKDSSFYDEAKWEGVTAFKALFKAALMHPSSFSLENRAGALRDPSDYGFYFPARSDWESVIDQVLTVVADRFESFSEQDPKVLSGAFQEYFYSLLQGYLEVDFGHRGLHVMAIRACKENIDRGGVENTKYLYYHLDEEYFSGPKKQEALNLIAGVFHSRALSARKRMIHIHRTHEVFNLMKLVDRCAFREDLQKLGTDSFVFEPVL